MEQVQHPSSPPARRRRLFVAWSVILLAVGIAVAIWHFRFRTYHFVEVHPGVLYRDGNRGITEFATACRKAGIRTVVMLVDDEEVEEEPFRREIEYCRANDIKLIHISVPLGTTVKTPKVRQFLDVVDDPKNHPVLVHCAQGVRRTGMMVAAYQQSVLGYDDARTRAAILAFGHSVRSTGGINRFIDYYDPDARTVNTPRKRGRNRRRVANNE